MTPQQPAEGIAITAKFKDSVFFKIDCQCSNTDDEVSFDIEVDDGYIIMNTYTTQKTLYWKKYSRFEWLNQFIHKLDVTWTVWTKGYVEYQSSTIMNQQQTLNLGHFLIDTVNNLDATRNRPNKEI